MQFLLLLATLKKFLFYIIVCLIGLFAASKSNAQYFKLQGIVYDSSRTYPMSGVSVLSTSGRGTSTDINGRYEIDVKESDSIWFSYLNKPTVKFPVNKIFDAGHFDIALHINIPVLKEVVIRPRDYRMDSIQNRLDYAKAFNWEKPKLKVSPVTDPTVAGVGFDLDEIIRMFQFRKNKSMAAFQQRLLQEERDKFIDHRYNKAVVLRLTGLTGAARDSFMAIYRPSFEFCIETPEYEFQAWIKQCYEEFKQKQLLQEERDMFIDRRYNKALVLRLTGLTGAARDSFMVIYRPSFQFCIETPEYEFQAWIKRCYKEFKSGKAHSELRKEHNFLP